MITVEVDVKDTIERKIIPREQDLIPVSFKRKFAFKGDYMEEMRYSLSISKVKIYYLLKKSYIWTKLVSG